MGAPGTTPGPWKLDSNPSFHRNRVWTQDMRPIVNLCSMGTAPSDLDPEAQANARLITASPDLYDQLTFAVKLLDGMLGFRGTAQLDRMHAALAKARGES